jgi:hypothetical protein
MDLGTIENAFATTADVIGFTTEKRRRETKLK